MKNLLSVLKISVPDKIFIKDPETSALGKRITEKSILLITEDFDYNSSMINIVNVKNSFEYLINESLLKQEGFTVLTSLKKHAIYEINFFVI